MDDLGNIDILDNIDSMDDSDNIDILDNTLTEDCGYQETILQSSSTIQLQQCLLCGQKCGRKSQEFNRKSDQKIFMEWKNRQVKSLCEVISINCTKYKSRLIGGFYCTYCTQILLNLEYTFKKIEDLKQILEKDKETVLQLISAQCEKLTKLNNSMCAKNSKNSHECNLNSNNIILEIASELNLSSGSSITNCYINFENFDTENLQNFPNTDFKNSATENSEGFPNVKFENSDSGSLEGFSDVNFENSDMETSGISPEDLGSDYPNTRSKNSTTAQNFRKKFKEGSEPEYSESESKSENHTGDSCSNDNNDWLSDGKSQENKRCKLSRTKTRKSPRREIGKLPRSKKDKLPRKKSETEDITCPVCPGKIFSSKTSLRNHTRSIHERLPPLNYKCDVEDCVQKFLKTNELNFHYEVEHPGVERTVTCADCGNTYFTNVQLRIHMEKTHRRISLKCAHCDKTFNSSTKRNAHQETHLTSRNYLCADCGKRFKTRKYLGLHRYSECANRSELLTATTIKRCEMRRQYALIRRSQKTCNTKLEQRCEICFYQTKGVEGSEELAKHQGLHIEKSPSITCVISECSMSETIFSNLTDLQSHVRSFHNEQKSRKVSCGPPRERCKKVPKTKIPKTNPMKYCQKDCGLAFSTWRELGEHRKEMNHNQERVKTYICDICGTGYTFPHHLRDHKLLVHTDNPPTKFPCITCGKEFLRKQVLHRHEKTHKATSFPCSKCGKCFKMTQYLRQHETLHCPYRGNDDNGSPVRTAAVCPRSQKVRKASIKHH